MSRSKVSTCSVLLLASCTVAFGAYPASYPFENEADPPAAVRASTPSYTYDDDDPGGYGYTTMYNYTLTDDALPWNPWVSGVYMWYSVVQKGWPELFSASVFNCTEASRRNHPPDGITFQAYSWPGKVGDWNFCEPGECCKQYIGTQARQSNDIDAQKEKHTEMKNVYEAGFCDQAYSEDAYCAKFSESFHSWCTEQYISSEERRVMVPCYDHDYKFYLFGCKLFKTTGRFKLESEPMVYYDKCTVQEIQANNGMRHYGDKVCRPYSYYFPEGAKGYVGDTGSTADNSSSESHILSIFIMLTFAFLG